MKISQSCLRSHCDLCLVISKLASLPGPDPETEVVLPSGSLHSIREWTRNHGFGSHSEFTKGCLSSGVAVVDVLMFDGNLLLLIVNVCILRSLKCTSG